MTEYKTMTFVLFLHVKYKTVESLNLPPNNDVFDAYEKKLGWWES